MAEYIERESAEAIFRNARRRMKPEMYKTFDEFNTRDCMLLNAEQLIHLLPAADVAPVVRGRWVKSKMSAWGYRQWYECSECGEPVFPSYGHPARTNFCHNCGADMREVQDD